MPKKPIPSGEELARLIAADREAMMLTPEERKGLRREARETMEFARKAFAHLRPKPPEKS